MIKIIPKAKGLDFITGLLSRPTTEDDWGVAVVPAQIHRGGLGLIALQEFMPPHTPGSKRKRDRAPSKICTGGSQTWNDTDLPYCYTWTVKGTHWAFDTRISPGGRANRRDINSIPKDRKGVQTGKMDSNAKFYTEKGTLFLRATKHIYPGDYIYAVYGKGYTPLKKNP